MRCSVESIGLDRERGAIVAAEVHVRFLACADQAADLGRETRIEDRFGGPSVAAFVEVDRPMVDSPLDARIEGRIVGHCGFV